MRKIILLLPVLLICGCRSIIPNRMFETPDGYTFAKDTLDPRASTIYQIQAFDKLEMHIYSNEGFKLVDVTQTQTGTGFGIAVNDNINYVVEENGMVKFPLLGDVNVLGLSIKELREKLEKSYSKYYNNPFVMVRVTNRHVLVFQGETGHGQFILLQNDNTSLFEALAIAGGITDLSRSYRIKIIRGDLHHPEIYLADIYSVEGLKNSELRVLSNDIIYIEGIPNYKQRILQQITPVIGIITAVLLVITLVNK